VLPVRVGVLKMVSIKGTVLQSVTQCRFVARYQHFGKNFYFQYSLFYLISSISRMEATGSSETLVRVY